jgi:hypothetical protein
MDSWYRVVISRSSLPQPAEDGIKLLMNSAQQELKKAGYPKGAQIFSNNLSPENRIYYLSPEAAEVLQHKWLDDYSAEVCEEPDLQTLREKKFA